MKPSQAQKILPRHICVFGEPKTGKSTLVSKLLVEAPDLKIVWLSMDNGHEVIFKLPLTPEQLDERLELIILPDTKEHQVAFKTTRAILMGKRVKICDAHGEVNCAICSSKGGSFTTLDPNSWGPETVLVLDHAGQISTSAMNCVYVKNKKDEDTKPEWPDYALQGQWLDALFTYIQQARYHVICITHVMESEQEDKTKKLVPMAGTSNFSLNMGKYFGHIVFCSMVNGKHTYGSSTGYQGKVVTGSRSDVQIEKMAIPSLLPFFDGSIPHPDNRKQQGTQAAQAVLATVKQEPEPEQERKVADEGSGNNSDDSGSNSSVGFIPTAPQPLPILSAQERIVTTPPPPTLDRVALLAKLKNGRT